MAELVELIPVEDEATDRKILEMRVAGSSVHEIAKQLMLPQHEVSRRLDRNLPQIDASFRRRQISLSLLRIDELTETFHKQAKTGDIEAGNLIVRLEAERRALLGLTGSGYDPVQLIQNNSGERSTAAWERALARLAGDVGAISKFSKSVDLARQLYFRPLRLQGNSAGANRTVRKSLILQTVAFRSPFHRVAGTNRGTRREVSR